MSFRTKMTSSSCSPSPFSSPSTSSGESDESKRLNLKRKRHTSPSCERSPKRIHISPMASTAHSTLPVNYLSDNLPQEVSTFGFGVSAPSVAAVVIDSPVEIDYAGYNFSPYPEIDLQRFPNSCGSAFSPFWYHF